MSAGLMMIRGSLVFAAAWGLMELLRKVFHLGTGWPLWTIALITAVAVEFIIFLYRYEQSAVGRTKGRWLTALRLLALVALIWMLLQPVFSRKVNRELEQEVIVVMDDSASMDLVDPGQTASRYDISKDAINASGLFEALKGKVGVRIVRAARKTLSEGEEAAEGWDQATDLAKAMTTVLEQVPPDNLAGLVMVTDGRHNRPGRVEDIARRFGILDAPIGVVGIGSETPPRDAAILEVRSPDAIYLGDRLRVATVLKFDGYRGRRAKVLLKKGDEIVQEQVISIPQDHHREEVRFNDVPEEDGINAYTVELENLGEEFFDRNNSWQFETAITDARTNVLIVDSHPRWEFRYLRNLFYGRDKSIHLQYVLLEPDTILGQQVVPVPASAARKFGDAQATRLPESEEEWRKFDVIIIGDVPPEAIGENTWQTIQSCVTERAAFLVAIAGPRHMPHAIESGIARELLPVKYTPSRRTFFGTKEPPYRLILTAEGRNHPITAQSDSRLENERLWGEFPEFRWRHPVEGVKEGASILVVASSEDDGEVSVNNADDLSNALSRLAQRKEREARNAILVAQQVGNGKVAMLLTDRSWRLREGVGDIYHHRFWGQLVRWGAGPNLRSGTASVRLGTDHLSYTGDDKLQITARLWDVEKNPVKDESLKAEVWRDGEKLVTVQMRYVEGSPGLHKAQAGPFPGSGNYQIKLVGKKASDLLEAEGEGGVSTAFRVVGAMSPVELSETTLNRPLLDTLAELSGGRVVAPEEAGQLAGLFLTGEETREELRETRLWDHWALLVLFCALLTSEWVIRRRSGLP
ncbi:MAG: VWA domain-containing protein [Roseibacillus sp.]|nr:VWA domain-containing protein [Roseibacillus sp.]